MNARSRIVRLLEEVLEVIGETEEVVAVRVRCACTAELCVVLGGLEDEARGWSRAFALTGRSTATEHGQRGVRAVPGVDVDRSVRCDAVASGRRGSRPIEDVHDPRCGNVGMGCCCGSPTDASVSHGDDLRRAVVSRCVRHVRPEDHASTVFVVLLSHHEVLDPRNGRQFSNCIELRPVGGNGEDVT